MFWEKELSSLAARRERLVAASDLERVLIQLHVRNAVHALHWLDLVRQVYHSARPFLWLAVPLLGYGATAGVRRRRRWLGALSSLWSGARLASRALRFLTARWKS